MSLIPELYCSNIITSLNFYIEILGFNIKYQREAEGFAMLERQGSYIMLDEIAKNKSVKRIWVTGKMEKPFGRGINLQIQTDKVDELFARVKAADAAIYLPMEDKWYRAGDSEIGNRQFIVQDPDGYLLRFVEDLGEISQ